MNALACLFAAALISSATASLLPLVAPAAPATLLQGPSSAAAVLGPDGSSITTATRGGAVVAAPAVGGVVTAASPAALVAPAWGIAPGAVLATPSGAVISSGLGLSKIVSPGILLG